MRERKRRHDDVHYPMQGRGKKGTPRKAKHVASGPKCKDCGKFPEGATHLCVVPSYTKPVREDRYALAIREAIEDQREQDAKRADDEAMPVEGDEWDRGFNAGVRAVASALRKHTKQENQPK